VFVQPNGRYVVRGPNGREHIFEADGQQVTSLGDPRSAAAHRQKVQAGQRRAASDGEYERFRELFQ
jgi:hypothetical protein